MEIFDVHRLALSALIGGGIALCFALLWHLASSASLPLGSPSAMETLSFVAALVLCHEASHLLGFPRAGLDSNTVIGIWPKIASPYVQYCSPMSRNRFMVACALPVLTLSIFPLVLVSIGVGSVACLSWLSVLNCVGAGSDLFVCYILLTVVPADALVLESDGKIYWTKSAGIQSNTGSVSI